MMRIKRLLMPIGLVAGFGLAYASSASADTAMQCNQKLSNTLLDRSATTEELKNPAPMGRVNQLLQDDDFKEYFARFVNAHMNWGPKDGQDENPVYNSLIGYVFKNDLQWKELFTHQREIVGQNANPSPTAVGYFNHKNWKKRYEGNEEGGFKLRTGYMMMNNMIGLNLEAVTVSADGGSGRESRSNPDSVCYHCHYRFDFALDKVANILPKVNRANMDVMNRQDLPVDPNASEVVYGSEVNDLRSFAEMLATRDEFDTNACNIAFEFTFGRPADGSDPEVFDSCVAKFKQTGKILDAVRHFVESPIFCQDLEV